LHDIFTLGKHYARNLSYKLKIRGIPAKWTSLITNWQPMTEFADLQV